MEKLSDPSKALASRILTEVGFDERLIGYRLHERTGAMPVTLYSFEEIVGLLMDPHPRIDFHGLEQWIREIIGDEELSKKIKAVIEAGTSEQDRSHRIRDLMIERLLQCKVATRGFHP